MLHFNYNPELGDKLAMYQIFTISLYKTFISAKVGPAGRGASQKDICT
jgi:hypothetical protein